MTILEITDTDIGTFSLSQREVEGVSSKVVEILLGADVLMSSLDPVSERRLSTSALALCNRDAPLRVLIGGLGLGYTAEAALAATGVGSVRVVEKMDFVIDWMQRGLLPLSALFATEERLEIAKGDVYDYLLGPPSQCFDLILIDVDHAPDDPLSESSMPFYTVEGQRSVARHLSPGGILGVWSATDDEDFRRTLAEVYPDSQVEDVFWDDLEFPEADFQNVLFFARAAEA